MAANNVHKEQIKKIFGTPNKYVFSYDCTNNIHVQDTILNKFIDYNNTSCTRVIEDIRDNTYKFKTKHKFVIIYSERLNRYFCLTAMYNYIYLLRKIIEHKLQNKLFYTADSDESKIDGDTQIDLLISENECLRDTFKYKIYSLCLNDVPELCNSIYNIFHTDNNSFYLRNNEEYRLQRHDILINMIESSVHSVNSDKNSCVVNAPFVSFSLNSVGFPQKIVFFSQKQSILDSIYYNIINNYNDVIINDINIGRHFFYFNIRQQFYNKKLGVFNYKFIHFDKENYENKNICDIYNKINLSKYYVIFTKVDVYNVHQMTIVKKNIYNKYINTVRDDMVLFRKQYRT